MIQRIDNPGDDFLALIQRMGQGCDRAAWQLVEQFGSDIRAVVRRRMNPGMRKFLDSEDFVQSVWVSLIRISPRLGTIKEPRQLIALLAEMASNKVIDQVRRDNAQKNGGALERRGKQIDVDAAPAAMPTASQVAIARERWQRLVEQESEQCRRIVQLKISGKSCVDIAADLGVNERTVRRVIARLIEKEALDSN